MSLSDNYKQPEKLICVDCGEKPEGHFQKYVLCKLLYLSKHPNHKFSFDNIYLSPSKDTSTADAVRARHSAKAATNEQDDDVRNSSLVPPTMTTISEDVPQNMRVVGKLTVLKPLPGGQPSLAQYFKAPSTAEDIRQEKFEQEQKNAFNDGVFKHATSVAPKRRRRQVLEAQSNLLSSKSNVSTVLNSLNYLI